MLGNLQIHPSHDPSQIRRIDADRGEDEFERKAAKNAKPTERQSDPLNILNNAKGRRLPNAKPRSGEGFPNEDEDDLKGTKRRT